MANIGILGGTFDPIHKGHLALGQQAYEQFKLDQIWFMPSSLPPHKRAQKVTEGTERQDMVKLAIRDYPWFQYSDFEFRRHGNSYTAQTLMLLKEAYPHDKFYFIEGADSLYEIEDWYHPEMVMHETTILVAGRPYKHTHRPLDLQIAYLKDKYSARIERIHFEEMDISSETVRKAAKQGCDLTKWLPDEVAEYIKAHGLYQ